MMVGRDYQTNQASIYAVGDAIELVNQVDDLDCLIGLA